MGLQKFTLCPACTACPAVEITDQGVTIGEEGNTVRLSHAEWNELVRLVKSGRASRGLIPSSVGVAAARSKARDEPRHPVHIGAIGITKFRDRLALLQARQ